MQVVSCVGGYSENPVAVFDRLGGAEQHHALFRVGAEDANLALIGADVLGRQVDAADHLCSDQVFWLIYCA